MRHWTFVVQIGDGDIGFFVVDDLPPGAPGIPGRNFLMKGKGYAVAQRVFDLAGDGEVAEFV